MKSGKQKRNELKAKKAAKCAKRGTRGPSSLGCVGGQSALKKGIAVNRDALAPDGRYDVPKFVRRGYYVDIPFSCQSCGKEEIWKARQQEWWCEVAKGGVWTTARLCRPCRRRERERREEARRIHLEGLAKKKRQNEGE